MEERRGDKVEVSIIILISGSIFSGGQTGERALVQEEQMGALLTPGKISLKR